MRSSILRRLFFPSLALLASVSSAQPGESRHDFRINPAFTASGRAFTLELLSHGFNCAVTYDHLTAETDTAARRITLSFLPTEHPDRMCPMVYRPYGPSFGLRPLPPGEYEVYARVLAPCMVGPGEVCLMEAVPQFAGTLAVGTERAGWFLQPRRVPAGSPFTLRLLNHAHGDCRTAFSGESLEVRGTVLHATFLVEKNPEYVCVTEMRPHGPSFEVPGLAAGKYPVRVYPQSGCRCLDPPCAVIPPEQILPVDTLEVFPEARSPRP